MQRRLQKDRQLQVLAPSGDASFSPAQALWNQRERLAQMAAGIKELQAAVESPGEFSLYQWTQLTALVLEFQPDLVIELGRGMGNSTACFLESIWQRGDGRLISVCLDTRWHRITARRLRRLRPPQWFARGQILEHNVLNFDFAQALGDCKRCLLFWDSPGFEVAGCVLGSLLPSLAQRQHLVVMHDISDLRFTSAERQYGSQALWGADDGKASPSFFLGPIFSRVAQAISILDFATRNRLPLHSADESFAAELADSPQKSAELRQLLGPELSDMQGHWLWFRLQEAAGSLSFPAYSADAAMHRFTAHEEISAMQNSHVWRIVKSWRKFLSVVAPEDTWRRSAYNLCLLPLKLIWRRGNSQPA